MSRSLSSPKKKIHERSCCTGETAEYFLLENSIILAFNAETIRARKITIKMESTSTPFNQKKSWSDLHQHVKDARKLQAKLTNMVPDMFTFSERNDKTRLYFLGVPAGKRQNTLMYCDIDDTGSCAEWKHLLDVEENQNGEVTLSKEEQLLQERMRSSLKGLTSYSMHAKSGNIVFASGSRLYSCQDPDWTMTPLPVSTLKTTSSGTKLDSKICPTDPDLIAYVSNGDIWVYDMFSHSDNRLTFSRKGSVGAGVLDDAVSSGLPSYIIQEEFDRYSGYWWQPTDTTSTDGTYRILYEEVNESEVDVISIASSTAELSGVEHYRYPRPGTTNASCKLRLLEFTISGSERTLTASTLDLHSDLKVLYPWYEYIVRVGWCPDGQRVWAQLLDRKQLRIALVLIPLAYFVYDSDQMVNSDAQPWIIHEETSDVWINVDNCLQFIPNTDSNIIEYIWASERTEYKHLYHCAYDMNTGSSISQPITIGEWTVSSSSPVYVDTERSLVYFNANKDTPLETHLYCVSIVTGIIQRLTPLGSHQQTLINESCSLVLSTFSSVETNPSCTLYKITHDNDKTWITPSNIILALSELDQGYTPPQILPCPIEDGKTMMYAMVYKPHNYQPGCKYPTVLYIYGGPQVQMVVNSNRALRLIRLHTLASLGYAVVLIDSRGSIGRGLRWESHIKDRMGTVEIGDQVAGLQYLASTLGFIDMSRVAIHGWSYGGYMSLMGLVQRPDVFKVSISGAPVTKWEYYDTGYTERYMSLPTDNVSGYKSASVINYIDLFPNEDDRLLLIHGMIDENVHLVHTSCLVDELIKACKPYRLQLYPNERHGIRKPEAGQHFETMVLSYLQDHL